MGVRAPAIGPLKFDPKRHFEPPSLGADAAIERRRGSSNAPVDYQAVSPPTRRSSDSSRRRQNGPHRCRRPQALLMEAEVAVALSMTVTHKNPGFNAGMPAVDFDAPNCNAGAGHRNPSDEDGDGEPAWPPVVSDGAQSGAPALAECFGATPELIGMVVAAPTGVLFKLPSGRCPTFSSDRGLCCSERFSLQYRPFSIPGQTARCCCCVSCAALQRRFSRRSRPPMWRASAMWAGARLGWSSSANDLGATARPLLGGLILCATASFAASYLLVGLLRALALGLVLRGLHSAAGSMPRAIGFM